MDIALASQKYPKAYALLMSPEMKSTLKTPIISNQLFYEFFDFQNLFISILRFGQESEINDGKWWMYTFTDTDLDGDQVYYTSRPEAEQAAFERAFEILNNKL